ncbi:hypothetical protein [Vibrio misgurnus]|uniref:hypothetical protein n=1 Tax=Vibrio misgurnus TaxID=2993714 RepID=UPI0024180B6E|nr:hypothetical protein [Vibrio sp. gvc]
MIAIGLAPDTSDNHAITQTRKRKIKSPPAWWGNGRENSRYYYLPSIPQKSAFFKSASIELKPAFKKNNLIDIQ